MSPLYHYDGHCPHCMSSKSEEFEGYLTIVRDVCHFLLTVRDGAPVEKLFAILAHYGNIVSPPPYDEDAIVHSICSGGWISFVAHAATAYAPLYHHLEKIMPLLRRPHFFLPLALNKTTIVSPVAATTDSLISATSWALYSEIISRMDLRSSLKLCTDVDNGWDPLILLDHDRTSFEVQPRDENEDVYGSDPNYDPRIVLPSESEIDKDESEAAPAKEIRISDELESKRRFMDNNKPGPRRTIDQLVQQACDGGCLKELSAYIQSSGLAQFEPVQKSLEWGAAMHAAHINPDDCNPAPD